MRHKTSIQILILLNVLSSTLHLARGIVNKNPSYQVLPLIFIKINEGMDVATDIDSNNIKLSRGIHFRRSQFKEEQFFCPIDQIKHREKIQKANDIEKSFNQNYGISRNCLVTKSPGFSFGKANIPVCDSEPEPVIWNASKKRQFDSEASFSIPSTSQVPESIVEQFTFVYQLCIEHSMFEQVLSCVTGIESSFPFKDLLDFNAYDFWYDTQKKTVLYTRHKIMSEKLLFDERMENERKVEYYDDTHGYDIFGENFAEQKQKFDEIEKNTPFKMQKLVPPEDFPFALWKKPSYHYININLMHEELHPIWKKVNDNERLLSKWAPGTDKFIIHTGVFNLPETAEDSLQTISNFDIPQLWVKIFHTERQESTSDQEPKIKIKAAAIIANNYMNDDFAPIITENYCEKNQCANFQEEDYPETHKYIYCCEVTAKLLQLFNLDLQIDESLEF